MNKFSRISDAIKTATGIEVSVFSTSEIESVNPEIAVKLEENDIVTHDNNKVYFTFLEDSSGYVGVFDRRGAEDVNFARLFRQMASMAQADTFDNLSQAEKLRLLLKGELGDEKREVVKNSIKKSGATYYALALVCTNKAKREELEEYVENVKEKDDFSLALNENTLVYLKKAGSGYESAIDFARILYESIKEELLIDLTVAVAGEVKTFEDFASSYKKELTAIKYGKMLFPKDRVYYYNDFALAQILTKVPKTELVRAYSSLVGVKDVRVWEDVELSETAEAFIKCSLNVSETSRIMNIHRNTLMYRLDKIKRETGFDLRKFEDASTFNLIDLIRKTLAVDVQSDKK